MSEEKYNNEDQFIHNLVNEIYLMKRNINIKFDEEFCKFYIKLLLCNPDWKINTDNFLEIRDNITELINFLITTFQSQDSPSLTSVKTRFYTLTKLDNWKEIEKQRQTELLNKLIRLKTSIIEPPDRFDLVTIFQQIVMYLIMASGLGNPKDKQVVKASYQVLKSILTLTELNDFLNLPYVIRGQELSKLIQLFTGIRIFNMNCDRELAGVPDLPNILFKAIDAVKTFFASIQFEALQKVHLMTSIIKNWFVLKLVDNEINVKVKLPTGLTQENLDYNLSLLVAFKQFSKVLCRLIEEIDRIAQDSLKLQDQYKETLDKLNAKVTPNFFISAKAVFPHFQELSTYWSKFQDKVVLLKILKQMAETEEKRLNMLQLPVYITMSLSRLPLLSLKDENGSDTGSEEGVCTILSKKNVECSLICKGSESFEAMAFGYEYDGHCCFMLAETNGFLILGEEKLGIVLFRERRYIFSSSLAQIMFARDPLHYINSVLSIARKKPELIVYLNLTEELEKFKTVTNLIIPKRKNLKGINVGCQVDTHILETYIDRSYSSNIWDHKRWAFHKAQLSNFKTVSMQTFKQSSISTKHSQTWPLVDSSTQTLKTSYTNTPKPVSFIYGLRGRKDKKPEKLVLWNSEFIEANKEFLM